MNDNATLISPLIVLASGGTGGHIFPAEALAFELARRGCRLAFVTDHLKGKEIVTNLGGVETYSIRAKAIMGKRLVSKVASLLHLFVGVLQSRQLLKRLRPDVVVGFGGYPSLPMMLAAVYSPTPTVIHEQNALLGRTNRFLLSKVGKIASSHKQMAQLPEKVREKVVFTGMPVREAVYALRQTPYPKINNRTNFNILIFGGSQGASVFSSVVPDAINLLEREIRSRLVVVQQCRPEDLAQVELMYNRLQIKAEISTFFSDLPKRIAEAHLVVSRSGASTIAEITTIGRPAILVPYPNAIDDHQFHNANTLEAGGGGWLIDNKDLTAETLAQRISDLVQLPVKLEKAARLSKKIGQGNAANRLAELIMTLTIENSSRTS